MAGVLRWMRHHVAPLDMQVISEPKKMPKPHSKIRSRHTSAASTMAFADA